MSLRKAQPLLLRVLGVAVVALALSEGAIVRELIARVGAIVGELFEANRAGLVAARSGELVAKRALVVALCLPFVAGLALVLVPREHARTRRAAALLGACGAASAWLALEALRPCPCKCWPAPPPPTLDPWLFTLILLAAGLSLWLDRNSPWSRATAWCLATLLLVLASETPGPERSTASLHLQAQTFLLTVAFGVLHLAQRPDEPWIAGPHELLRRAVGVQAFLFVVLTSSWLPDCTIVALVFGSALLAFAPRDAVRAVWVGAFLAVLALAHAAWEGASVTHLLRTLLLALEAAVISVVPQLKTVLTLFQDERAPRALVWRRQDGDDLRAKEKPRGRASRPALLPGRRTAA